MKRTGILAGAFNPVTRAHAALAQAARSAVDEIACVIPRSYPHKELHGATIEQRVQMIEKARIADRIEITEGGLFIDIARELRRPGEEIIFVCGADAAERVMHWDYGGRGAIERMLQEFSMLVAPRVGHYIAPEHLRGRVHELHMPAGYEDVSSTEVRSRIAAGEAWAELVPEAIVGMVRGIYDAGQERRSKRRAD